MLRTLILISIALLASCSTEETITSPPNNDPTASYRVTFTSAWLSEDFPTNFPSNAHFSGIIGATHSDRAVFWKTGQTASLGIEAMAETGGKLDLIDEIDVATASGDAEFTLDGGNIPSTSTSVSLDFTINKDYPLVTLVSMLAPSPDWFVGVRDLSLYNNSAGGWEDSVTVDLHVYDAGTDDGLQFESADADTQPRGVITRLTSDASDSDFVDGVHRDTLDMIGQMVFTRMENTTSSNP